MRKLPFPRLTPGSRKQPKIERTPAEAEVDRQRSAVRKPRKAVRLTPRGELVLGSTALVVVVAVLFISAQILAPVQ